MVLLDNARKPATPLTNGAINERWSSFPHTATITCFSWLIAVNRRR